MRYVNPNLAIKLLDNEVRRDLNLNGFDQGVNYGLKIAKRVLSTPKDLPNEDVAPVIHAYWKYNKHAAPYEKMYYCSHCITGGSDMGTDKYCHECGAKMENLQ